MLDSDKKEIIKRMLKVLPVMSDKRIAWILDCEAKEVNEIRRDMTASGELPRIEADEEGANDI